MYCSIYQGLDKTIIIIYSFNCLIAVGAKCHPIVKLAIYCMFYDLYALHINTTVQVFNGTTRSKIQLFG